MTLYLSSYEYSDFDKPRKIINFIKYRIDQRNVLIVEVEEPLFGQNYGLGGKDITRFYLVNRVDEDAFESFKRFPIDVHVLIDKNFKESISSLSDLESIGWACLYDKENDAAKHKIV
jgi:hypothetical protein